MVGDHAVERRRRGPARVVGARQRMLRSAGHSLERVMGVRQRHSLVSCPRDANARLSELAWLLVMMSGARTSRPRPGRLGDYWHHSTRGTRRPRSRRCRRIRRRWSRARGCGPTRPWLFAYRVCCVSAVEQMTPMLDIGGAGPAMPTPAPRAARGNADHLASRSRRDSGIREVRRRSIRLARTTPDRLRDGAASWHPVLRKGLIDKCSVRKTVRSRCLELYLLAIP
jgi:hypothetical protein